MSEKTSGLYQAPVREEFEVPMQGATGSFKITIQFLAANGEWERILVFAYRDHFILF